jgi:MurNAc alpha-1-phosphate uridylyltransferase
MRPLTLETPKPLLQVHGISLIEHHIRRLAEAGICDLIVNIAYLGEKIRTALGDGSSLGVRIQYSVEPEPLETAGALHHALPLLGDAPFLLVNGDVWTDYPFARLRDYSLNGDGHLVLVPNPSHKTAGDFALSTDGAVRMLATGGGLTFSGISLLSPRLVRDYPRVRRQFPLREVFEWAIQRSALTGEQFSGAWCDVGTPARLAELNR